MYSSCVLSQSKKNTIFDPAPGLEQTGESVRIDSRPLCLSVEILRHSPGKALNLAFQPADGSGVSEDELIERELMLNRFRRLMKELQAGEIKRQHFQPWEIEILLDLENCQLDRRRRADILRQYIRTVERQLESGPGPPLKLSEFLAQRGQRNSENG